MKGKILLISMALLLTVGLVATGCAPAPEAEKVHWTFVTSEATRAEWNNVLCQELVDDVLARTEGNFEIEFYMGPEVGLGREAIPRAVATRAIDMGWHAHGHVTGMFPFMGIYSIPFLVVDQVADGNKVEAAIGDIIAREWAKEGLGYGPYVAMTACGIVSKKSVDDISDMKGLKCRAWDDVTEQILSSLKAVPIIMAYSETYVAMQRGVVDAVMTGVPGMVAMSLYEEGKYLYLVGLAGAHTALSYNLDSFAELPKEYQDILLDAFERYSERGIEAQPIADKEAKDIMAANGVELITPPADQFDRARAQVMGMWDTWGAENPVNKEVLDKAKAALGLT